MKTVTQMIVAILQVIVADFLGLVPALALGVGNGWELLVLVLGFSLGVWGVGALADRIRKSYRAREQGIRLAATFLVSGLGVGVILLSPSIGFIQILYPLIGAFLGYYLSPLFLRR